MINPSNLGVMHSGLGQAYPRPGGTYIATTDAVMQALQAQQLSQAQYVDSLLKPYNPPVSLGISIRDELQIEINAWLKDAL